MKLLWHGDWLEAPRYSEVEHGRLVVVEASVPLAPVRFAGGRVIESPRRKVATFLRTDGLRATIRKARSKQTEDDYLGDYWTSLVLGEAGGERVVALAPRMPVSAERLLVHERLAMAVDDGFDVAALERAAARLGSRVGELQRLGNQTYLYSGAEPPERLVEILRAIVEWRGEGAGAPARTALRPRTGGAGRTLIEVGRRGEERGGIPLAVLGAGDYVRIEVGPALRARGTAAGGDLRSRAAGRGAGRGGPRLRRRRHRPARGDRPVAGARDRRRRHQPRLARRARHRRARGWAPGLPREADDRLRGGPTAPPGGRRPLSRPARGRLQPPLQPTRPPRRGDAWRRWMHRERSPP